MMNFIFWVMFIAVLVCGCCVASMKYSCDKWRNNYFTILDANANLMARSRDLEERIKESPYDCTPVLDFEAMKAFSVERKPTDGKVIIGYIGPHNDIREWALEGLDDNQYRELLADYRLYLAGKE